MKAYWLKYMPPVFALKSFHFAHTLYACTPFDLFYKTATVSPFSIDCLLCVIEADYVLCEVQTEYLHVI